MQPCSLVNILSPESQKYKDRAAGFQVALTTRLLRQLSLSDRQVSIGSDDDEYDKWGYFGMLPVSVHYCL